MTRDELLELVAEVQRHQSELEAVEVKSARGGLSQIYPNSIQNDLG